MILHHFTSMVHLPFIESAGEIRTTESNIGSPRKDWPPFGERRGPDVVWLLDDPDLSLGHGLGGFADKTAVQITVNIPDAIKWTMWRETKRMHPLWKRQLIRAGGGNLAAEHWYVALTPIARHCWVEINAPKLVAS